MQRRAKAENAALRRDPVYRNRCALREQLSRVLPPIAMMQYDSLIGGLFGDNIDDVIRFALISFLHDRSATIDRFRRPIQSQSIRA